MDRDNSLVAMHKIFYASYKFYIKQIIGSAITAQ